MTLLLYIVSYVVLILFQAYSILRYYHLWKRLEIKGTVGPLSRSLFIYLVIHGVLMVNLLICLYGAAWVFNDMVLTVMQIISCIYFNILIFSPVLCFLRGLVRFFGKFKKKKGRIYRFFNHPAKTIYIIMILTAGVGVFSFVNMKTIRVQEYPVQIEKTAENDTMTIVLVSDIHLGSSMTQDGLDQLIGKANDLSPDLVVLCGDTTDRNTSDAWKREGLRQLSEIKSTYGVCCVPGDREIKDGGDIEGYYEDAGITVLKDRGIYYKNGVQVVGICDSEDPEKRDLKTAMSGMDLEKPLIALSHRPEQLPEIAQLGADLVLCGHAFGEPYPLKPAFHLLSGDTLIYGEEKIGGMSAILTSGAGRYGIPSRLLSRSEIVAVRLSFKR